MASSSSTSLVSAAAPPACAGAGTGTGTGTDRAPASIRLYYQQQQQQQQRRLVAAGAKRRYKGTARKEAALADLIERKVAEATEACTGQAGEEGCRVAWDEVEEVSRAKADLRRRVAEGAHDPLEHFCAHNPLADDCTVVYDD